MLLRMKCTHRSLGDLVKSSLWLRWGLDSGFATNFQVRWASLVAQRLKRLPGMQETWVRSLGQEDPLEKEMATHSSILAWRIPWREEPGRLQSTRSQRVGHKWATSLWWHYGTNQEGIGGKAGDGNTLVLEGGGKQLASAKGLSGG